MKKTLVLATVVLAGAASAASAQTFTMTLAGGREAGTGGDPNGKGLAVVTIDGTTVRYYVWVKGIDAPTAAHIHSGGAGKDGAPVVTFGAAFTSPTAGVFVASGSATTDATTAQALVANPAGYYVNVHTGPFPAGAVRGQLLGDGPASYALATDLLGRRELSPAGDPNGSGFAATVFDGGTVYYYLFVKGIAAPTAAHIHAGGAQQSGAPVISFGPTFTDGVATGSVAADAATVAKILAAPDTYYVNVHTGDFPNGALRGQLGATETALHFSVLARNAGAGTSNFKSNVRVLNLADEDATFYVEWFPKGAAGASGPAALSKQVVVAGGEAVYDDVIGTLFGANDRGAVRITSAFALRAVANTFNDQRASGNGTFGQFVEALGLDRAYASGVLVYNSNRPKADGVDYRTNAGFWNPNPYPVDVTFNIRKPDGTSVGQPSKKTLAAYSNDLALFYQIIPNVPTDQQTLANFFISYSATAPVFLFSSVVDNKTDDGFQQAAMPAPTALTATAAVTDTPPNGTITSPAGNVTINAGQSVSFAGTASDPDGDAVTVLWNFGDSVTSTALNPGNHTYANAGTYTVTFTATDSKGLADPTPDSRTITVTSASANNPPKGTITSPAGNVTINAGQSVSFAGTASDPDGDAVTVLWNFGDSVTSTALNPGNHTYANAGTYTVTFTATDSKGLADPTPDTRIITVNGGYSYAQIQAQIFTPICVGCHGGNAGLFLDAASSYSNLVNVASTEQPSVLRVKPGDPDNSYLYRKITGAAGITGVKMPKGGSLTQAQIDMIQGWILAGAQNN